MAVPVPDAGTLLTGGQTPLPSLVNARRLRMQRLGRSLRLWVPAGVLILLLAMCFLWPLVYQMPSSTNGNILDASEPPFSPGHWLGTDPVGVDIFSQIVYGGRVAFEIGITVNVIGIVIGSLVGVVAGYFGGWTDAVIARVLDVLIAFPGLVLALVISQALGPNVRDVILALCALSIPGLGRYVRGTVLVMRSSAYMTAAKLSGTRGWRIMIRHIVPNIAPVLATFGLIGIGFTIIIEGALDYLGYGIPPPQATWGSMIATGQTVMTAQPEYVIIPSIFLLVTVVALYLLGDALRERWGVQ